MTEAGCVLSVESTRGDATRLGVRPERILISRTPGTCNTIAVTIASLTYLGAHVDIKLDGPGNMRLACQLPNTTASRDLSLAPGLQAFASFQPQDCVLFTE